MKNYYTVDRIESDFAVLECPDGSFSNIMLSFLPTGTKEGSVLLKNIDGSFRISDNSEKSQRKNVFELQKEIFKNK